MKTPSDNLFLFIKSLEPSEKAYFKRYSGEKNLQEKDKTYILLFDTIDQFNKYDEEKLRQALKGKIELRHLSKLKNYLMESILESLKNYHSDTSPILLLNKYLSHIELLNQKGLYKKALTLIQKAKTLANEHELHYYLMMLDNNEQNTRVQINSNPKIWSEGIKNTIQKHKLCFEKINNRLLYQQLQAKSYALFERMYIANTKQDKEMVNVFFKQAALKDFNKATTLLSKLYFLFTSLMYLQLTKAKNYKHKYYQILLKINECFETLTEKQLQYHAEKYLNSISNFIDFVSGEISSFEDVENSYKKAILFYNNLPNKLKSKQLKNKLRKLKWKYIRALLHYQYFEEALLLSEKEIELLQTSSKKGSSNEVNIGLEYIYFCAAFILSNFQKASKSLNRSLNVNENDFSKIYLRFFRLMNIITNYERGTIDNLPYIIKSTERHFKKDRGVSKFEKQFFQFFKKEIPKVEKGTKEERLAFIKFYALVKSLLHSEILSQGFDFKLWIQSKMQQRPLLDMYREKVGQPHQNLSKF